MLSARMMVRKERLELSRPEALEPKSSASANSATFACEERHSTNLPGRCNYHKGNSELGAIQLAMGHGILVTLYVVVIIQQL